VSATTNPFRRCGIRLRAGTSSTLRAASGVAQQVLEDITDAVFPAGCRVCDAEIPTPDPVPHGARRYRRLFDGTVRRRIVGPLSLPLRFLCPACTSTLQPVRRLAKLADSEIPCITRFEPAPALFELVHALKYEAFVELAPWLGLRLAAAARRGFGLGAVLVPVPLHPERERERGFNQSALLAECVARRLGCSVGVGLLERRRATAPQANLDRSGRAANVAGAFIRAAPLPPGAARIVLVDDVVTTGETARAALAALGCETERLAVLALCKAHDERDGRTGAGVGAGAALAGTT
jgi:ComF family protein